jgi:hypothetical protein
MYAITRLLVLSITAWCLAPAAGAATATTNPVQTEEITVYAEMSLRKLRLETNRVREAMFNVFNEINGDDRFDIQCEYVQRWQSKIREYECSPVYLKNAREQEVNLFLRSIGGEDGGFAGGQGGGAGLTQMDHFNALLAEQMQTAVREHPEFRQAVDEYNAISEYYAARLNGETGD